MLGAIAGDIIGSVYENFRTKNKDFRLFTPFSTFTDDTVLTVAVADAILRGADYGPTLKSYARRFPLRGFGPGFLRWALSPSDTPGNSFGNGSAMRVSPIAYAFPTEDDVLEQARLSAACSHGHPEGIRGAQATALAVFMARTHASKPEIRSALSTRFGYDLSRSIEDIRPNYHFDPTCPGSVPEALIAFLDSCDFEDAIRNAVSLGGDADTQAAIAGAVAEAFYGSISESILRELSARLKPEFIAVLVEFYRRFGTPPMLRQALALDPARHSHPPSLPHAADSRPPQS